RGLAGVVLAGDCGFGFGVGVAEGVGTRGALVGIACVVALGFAVVLLVLPILDDTPLEVPLDGCGVGVGVGAAAGMVGDGSGLVVALAIN
ncbi:hypothetical protein OFC08_30880, partial [Escherichia coli]|nr:hypothetical protein [Escherichia coli]